MFFPLGENDLNVRRNIPLENGENDHNIGATQKTFIAGRTTKTIFPVQFGNQMHIYGRSTVWHRVRAIGLSKID
jgi:hypothetical protein